MALLSFLQQLSQELHRATLINAILLSLLLVSPLLLLKLLRGGKLSKLPPSPPKLPLIGNLHQLGKLPHRSFRALSKRYGPLLLLHLGNVPTLVVSSADIAREIMKTHDITFANRVQTKAANVFYYGCTSVGFCPYGNYWRQVRKICVLELLSVKRVQSFQLEREEEVGELVRKISRLCGEKVSVNLGEMLLTISNNIVSKAVFGRKFEREIGKKSFGEVTRKAMELFAAFCFEDFFPSMGWMDVLTGLDASLKETSRVLDAFLDQVIDEHKTSNSDIIGQSDKKDFVEILLSIQKDGMLDINLTQNNLKGILLDMFAGGTDTTSATMEWAMAELMKNPTIMRKAQDEVRRVVGKKSKVDEVDVDKMDYLKYIIKETLRLYPPAPFLVPRESTANVTTLEGYDIPPKTRIFINAWAIQRDPKLWDRPKEFLPERFANSPVDFKGQDFQFIPFGGGRRGCPGITFGMVEAEYVLANLLYWFNWELPGGATGNDLDMGEVYGLVMHKKIPLHLVPSLHSH